MTLSNTAALAQSVLPLQRANQGFTFEAKPKTGSPGEYIVQSLVKTETTTQIRPGINNPQNNDPFSQIFNQVASPTVKSAHIDTYA